MSTFDTHAMGAGQSAELFATALQGAILDVRPDLIYYDDRRPDRRLVPARRG
ncbi:MAG: hypothetical protein JO021_14875 [Alphaproteobacteria bacterium]|nr:hypothetical protein [Alphaproteobacteria bacterium]